MSNANQFADRQSFTVKNDGKLSNIEIHCRDVSMYASHKVGAIWARGMFHQSGAWLTMTVNECPTGGRTRSTSITLYEPAARAIYAILHATYGESK